MTNKMRKISRILSLLLAVVLLFGAFSTPISAAEKNGLYKENGEWVYFRDGKIDQSFSGLAKNKYGWWMVTNGKVTFKYNGFVQNAYGWWYVRNSQVSFKINDVIKGTVNGETGWWYVRGNKVRFVDTLAKNENGWWKITKGKVDFNYTGFAQNENGWWYVQGGKIRMNANGLFKGEVNGITAWWHVKNSKVSFTKTTLAKNQNGWWKVTDGKVDFTYNGFEKNENGWWHVRNGKITFKETGIFDGTIDGKEGSYFVKGSKYRSGFSGLAKKNGIYSYVENGELNTDYSGPSQSVVENNKWYHVEDGLLQNGFTGYYSSEDNDYYVNEGLIQKSIFSKDDIVRYAGEEGTVEQGIVTTTKDDSYYSMENNQVRTDEGKFSYQGNSYYTEKGGKLVKNNYVHYAGDNYYAGENGALKKVNKVLYLTFDDGPGYYTDRLLDILKRHGAKATFFVNGNNGSSSYYRDCIGRAYREGHAIGNHTYSHNWASCYSSTSGFWSEFDRNNEIIKEQTGTTTRLLRFPGGSSNMVSANYSYGIMSRLASQCADKGVVYFDWNVDSGDAGGTTSSSGVYSNIISGIRRQGSGAVILCHDIKGYTVDAIDDVIRWGKSNGYVFMPLTVNSPTAHHGINN